MTPLTECLACGGSTLYQVLDLGAQPLANNYGETANYPLVLNACPKCDHAQLSVSVDPKKLFEHYLYVSGTTKTLTDWFGNFVDTVAGDPGTVLDIGSNDGTLLRIFQERGWEVLGVDPAANLTPKDIPTKVAFFGKDNIYGKFDVITAFNVVAHTPDPLSVMVGIRRNLAGDGTAYIMTSQGDMVRDGQFDTIYHEHHSFFSVRSMSALAQRAGLRVVSVTKQDIHGGSLLFEIRHQTNSLDFETYADMVNHTIAKSKEFNKPNVVAYGAAAKGVVFLNATGLKPEYVVDENPLKIGAKLPGTDIPVVGMTHLGNDKRNLVIIITAWNFAKEIEGKIKRLRPNNADEFVRFF